MSETSRRKFLAASGAGAVAGAVAVTSTAEAAQAAARPDKDGARESVVAYVKDHRLAEVRLLVGEREVVVQDRDLVTRILNAAGGK